MTLNSNEILVYTHTKHTDIQDCMTMRYHQICISYESDLHSIISQYGRHIICTVSSSYVTALMIVTLKASALNSTRVKCRKISSRLVVVIRGDYDDDDSQTGCCLDILVVIGTSAQEKSKDNQQQLQQHRQRNT